VDIVHQEIEKLQVNLESNNDTIWKKNKPIYKGLCYARGIINEIPTADVVPRSEIEKMFDEIEDCVIGIIEPSFQELKKKYTEGEK
jgi:hypothetical protein